MNKQERKKRINDLFWYRWFYENYRKQTKDQEEMAEINRILIAINNEYYDLLSKHQENL